MSSLPDTDFGQFETLFAYWCRLRDDAGGVPPRLSLDPVAIKELLPNIFLIERRAHDDLYVRLSGTAIDALSPAPMTGANYLDLCMPDTRDFVAESAKLVCMHPCGNRYKRAVTFEAGGCHEITTAALPMTDRHGAPTYILGIMSARTDYLTIAGKPRGYVSVKMLETDFFDVGFGVPETVPSI
ncbi:MAG: PAS domain-containing protein [Alphaproteobacteria bacterium]|nr:PAS domain-containing protein [Alphaproteobacteria bacterium]